MKTGTRIAIGVGIGYCLGRTKKLRLALMLAGAGTIGKIGSNPGELVRQGAKVVGASPELKTRTDELKGRIVEAGKAAAVATAGRRIGSLTDKLQERAELIRQPGDLTGDLMGGSRRDDEDERSKDEYDEDRSRSGGRSDYQEHQEDQERDAAQDEAAYDESDENEEYDRPQGGRAADDEGEDRPRRGRSARDEDEDENENENDEEYDERDRYDEYDDLEEAGRRRPTAGAGSRSPVRRAGR